jgi:hypothetical protein
MDLVPVDGFEAGSLRQIGERGGEAIRVGGVARNGTHGGIQHCCFEMERASVALFGDRDFGEHGLLGVVARGEAAGVGVDFRAEGLRSIAGRLMVLDWSPCCSALREERALPSAVTGPRDLAPLARLAAAFLSEVIFIGFGLETTASYLYYWDGVSK